MWANSRSKTLIVLTERMFTNWEDQAHFILKIIRHGSYRKWCNSAKSFPMRQMAPGEADHISVIGTKTLA